MISDHPINQAILSRHILFALGLDNRVLLTAAGDRFNGEVYIPDLMAKDNESMDARDGTV